MALKLSFITFNILLFDFINLAKGIFLFRVAAILRINCFCFASPHTERLHTNGPKDPVAGPLASLMVNFIRQLNAVNTCFLPLIPLNISGLRNLLENHKFHFEKIT